MSPHPTEERLNDWVDGSLDPTATAEIRSHIDACAECRDAVAGLRVVLALAARAPASIDPPAGTWDAIAARTTRSAELRREVLAGLRVPLAAAALVMLMLGAGATALLLRSNAPAGAVAIDQAPGSRVAAATLVLAEDTYQREYDRLLAEFRANRTGLDAATIAVVEDNLRIIEQALGRAHAALQRDPGNRELPHMITETHRKRIEIVERALRLSAKSERSSA